MKGGRSALVFYPALSRSQSCAIYFYYSTVAPSIPSHAFLDAPSSIAPALFQSVRTCVVQTANTQLTDIFLLQSPFRQEAPPRHPNAHRQKGGTDESASLHTAHYPESRARDDGPNAPLTETATGRLPPPAIAPAFPRRDDHRSVPVAHPAPANPRAAESLAHAVRAGLGLLLRVLGTAVPQPTALHQAGLRRARRRPRRCRCPSLSATFHPCAVSIG
ncbi:unnamed protein product [Mycena citricolor]|uniref:Uncharacterized protein n=1 Tax=Mycena citricolor TaxID=2018698 RepID=A0AAD2HCC4_9AGAR|nr:unnamed protein product [Mycena citricolor]